MTRMPKQIRSRSLERVPKTCHGGGINGLPHHWECYIRELPHYEALLVQMEYLEPMAIPRQKLLLHRGLRRMANKNAELRPNPKNLGANEPL